MYLNEQEKEKVIGKTIESFSMNAEKKEASNEQG